MRNFVFGIVLMLLVIFVASSNALAVTHGGWAPGEPVKYSCSSYQKDLEADAAQANEKAIHVIENTFNYISDTASYEFFQEQSADMENTYSLVNTLTIHRGLESKHRYLMNIIGEAMKKEGTSEYILKLCSRKGADVSEIATAMSMAYDELQ